MTKMTIKEVAEALKCSETTLRNAISELFPDFNEEWGLKRYWMNLMLLPLRII